MIELAMECWSVSLYEIMEKWTDEQLTLMMLKRIDRIRKQERERARASAQSKGSVLIYDDEIGGR